MFNAAKVRTSMLALVLLGIALLLPWDAFADHLLKPGDRVGGLTLRSFGVVDQSVPPIQRFCAVPLDFQTPQPGSYAVTCTVPALPRMFSGNGWFTDTQERLEENWTAMSFESYLDGHRIDEPAFGLLDGEIQTPDGPLKGRVYAVELQDLVGTHTLRQVLHLSRDVYDGYATFPAGSYEYVHSFTVEAAPPEGQALLPATGAAPVPLLPLAAVATVLLLVGGVLRGPRRSART